MPARVPAAATARGRRLVAALLAATAAALSLAVAPAGAAAPAPGVVPPVPAVQDALAVGWWQYVLSRPTATNPLLDPTGAHCADGQAGPVFFLTGVAGSGAAERDACVVRGPHAIFFPLLNGLDVHTPGDGRGTPQLIFEEFQGFGFRADTLFASVDGAPVPGLDPASRRFRACAAPIPGCFPPAFAVLLPADNLFGLDAGLHGPAVQDGYYLLLAPLAPGVHTIRFGGTGNFGGPTSQDVTYRLTVTR
jgi:hypothetical protein